MTTQGSGERCRRRGYTPQPVIEVVGMVERIWLWMGGCERPGAMKWIELENGEEHGRDGGKWLRRG